VLDCFRAKRSLPQHRLPSLFPARCVRRLRRVGQSLSGISIRRWKAPNEVKSAADQDVASIQRDLSGTLATLMDQADAAPGSVPAAFAVYRNVDALYDTLLRVVLTANLAAPDKRGEYSAGGSEQSGERARDAGRFEF